MHLWTAEIDIIHHQLASHISNNSFPLVSQIPSSQPLSSFHLPSAASITELIRKSKLSNCQLDPLPTTLIKACLLSLSNLITAIIHSSSTSGSVPLCLKRAAVMLIFRNPGSDPNNFINPPPYFQFATYLKFWKKKQLHLKFNFSFQQQPIWTFLVRIPSASQRRNGLTQNNQWLSSQRSFLTWLQFLTPSRSLSGTLLDWLKA